MLNEYSIALDRGYGAPSSMAMLEGLTKKWSPEAERRQDISQHVKFIDAPAEQLQSSGMALKIIASRYAMYLSHDDRVRLFGELDYLLDAEGWFFEDKHPSQLSFSDFMKWMVEAEKVNWTSLGLDAEGNLLVAYKAGGNLVTAAFLGNSVVHWTSKFTDEGGVEISAGQSPLSTFVKTSAMLIDRL